MHLSAESLAFPVDVAPLAHMVELSWPRLRDLALTGRFSDASQVSYMSRLVGSMCCPRSLSIQVAQLADHPRPRVLQKHQLRSIDMQGLQSLTLAYPNPDDAIFTVAGPSLRHLSLRDWPRYYTRFQWAFNSELEGLAMPIISSSECLRILARMSMPRLQHLELVYEADAMEEELLLHVGSAYSCLESFELHQYRSVSHGSIAVRFDRIAEILRSVTGLRILRLHLAYDQADTLTHGVYEPWAPQEADDELDCPFLVRITHRSRGRAWPFASAMVRYGDAILAIMKESGGCPLLKELYLLYSNNGPHRWVQFFPSHYPKPWTGIGAVSVDWDHKDENDFDFPPAYKSTGRRVRV
ncbi:hypothetical protein K466DRAFT_635978 [Polyporus arcularius HHB13444]|uniref:F-box domain-containing protein n=1 Tax=Polyporus arcularius HHB13444 TaxID=1314778 RepID=A0A5C3PNB6_9APHY|nr:hypothetical protein K466DRAFT_635978 [Polyporus arcularius HHB13444]